MANIVVTGFANGLDVDFGDYWRDSGQPIASPDVNAEQAFYHREEVREMWRENSFVYIQMDNKREWKLGLTQGIDNFVIDTVDGVAPTTVVDLYQKLRAIL